MAATTTSQDLGLFVLRVGTGLSLLAVHGAVKAMAAAGYLFQGREWPFVAEVQQMGFPLPGAFAVAAAVAETVCAVLLAAGVYTRANAAIVAFTMCIAIYYHVRVPESFEPAWMFLLCSVSLIAAGGGSWTLQRLSPRPASKSL